MPITMQGAWTIRVKSKNSPFAQRFVVSGADIGNGVYDGVPGVGVFVSGAQWSIAIQHQQGGLAWRDSAWRLGFPAALGGVLRVDIRSNTCGGGVGDDDLVLACSMPLCAADHVVFGRATAYSGDCLFNPGRDDHVVIDPAVPLYQLCQRHPRLRAVLHKLYPERMRGPWPLLDGPSIEPGPLVLPTALPFTANGLVVESALGTAPEVAGPQRPLGRVSSAFLAAVLDKRESEAVAALRARVQRSDFRADTLAAGVQRLSAADLAAIDALRDEGLRQPFRADAVPGLMLRWQRYERSEAERLGGPYTGCGERQDLGHALTDEFGHYLVRFTSRQAHAVPPHGRTVKAERPDLVVQVPGSGLAVSYESAPYQHVANVQRIDLCLPAESVELRSAAAFPAPTAMLRCRPRLAAAPQLASLQCAA